MHESQVVVGEPVGGPAVPRGPLRLNPGQRRVQLGEPAAPRRHAGPLVKAGQEHGPDVDGPGQDGQVRGHEHLDGHQDGGHGYHGKNDGAINVKRGTFGRIAWEKHSDPLEDGKLQCEIITSVVHLVRVVGFLSDFVSPAAGV